jgi:hypothetical protein
MSKINTIKAGYRLTVKSWENDGDHKNTIQQDGLTLEQVKFIVDIIGVYKISLGNMYSPKESELSEEKIALRKVISKYPNAKEMLYIEEEEEFQDDDIIVECVHDQILYDYMGSSEFYTRKYDGHTVEYIPVEITIEDVTNKLFSL